jgi:hypothetical protein
LITVPACSDHNSSLSKDEEYFRLAMAGAASKAYRPLAIDIALGQIRRSVIERPLMLQKLLREAVPISEPGPGGIQPALMLTFQRSRIDRVVEKIIRGLYFHLKGFPLGSAEINVHHFDYLDYTRHPEKWRPSVALQFPALIVNRDVFVCRYLIAEQDEHEVSGWWLTLYGAYLFLVTTSKYRQGYHRHSMAKGWF